MNTELDPERLDTFERILLASPSTRVRTRYLWSTLAHVFPHRASGPAERRLLLDTLRLLDTRGSIKLPSPAGARWDRSLDPPVPTSVDILREPATLTTFPWRTFPWHPQLQWVAQCRMLSAAQVEFLQRVHEGLVHDAFREPAPLKYRSLQLTGDEKKLALLANSSLFTAERLSLERLGCLPDALPLAWEAVGDGGRLVIFENAGPFAVARRVLCELEVKPYDLIAYGGGRSVLASLGHIKTFDRPVEAIHYVGDIDPAGLDIAWCARKCTETLGLPILQPASELHQQMLHSAHSFGHPEGWPTQNRCPDADRRRVLEFLDSGLRVAVDHILRTGQRIPEEILGPHELRQAWSA